jgi:hypothetical protein
MTWRRLLAGPLSAFVPEEVRDRLVRTVGIDPPLWSFLVGCLQLLVGALLLVDDFMRVIPDLVALHAGTYLDQADPAKFGVDERQTLFWSGSFSWLTWVIRPKVLLLGSFALWGLVRLTAFGVTREAVAEPVVWIGYRLWELGLLRPARAAERTVRFGPDRSDRIERPSPESLKVFAARPKLEWNDAVTIEHEERFYRLKSLAETPGKPYWWYVYELVEEDPAAVIRRLVRYQGA